MTPPSLADFQRSLTIPPRAVITGYNPVSGRVEAYDPMQILRESAPDLHATNFEASSVQRLQALAEMISYFLKKVGTLNASQIRHPKLRSIILRIQDSMEIIDPEIKLALKPNFASTAYNFFHLHQNYLKVFTDYYFIFLLSKLLPSDLLDFKRKQTGTFRSFISYVANKLFPNNVLEEPATKPEDAKPEPFSHRITTTLTGAEYILKIGRRGHELLKTLSEIQQDVTALIEEFTQAKLPSFDKINGECDLTESVTQLLASTEQLSEVINLIPNIIQGTALVLYKTSANTKFFDWLLIRPDSPLDFLLNLEPVKQLSEARQLAIFKPKRYLQRRMAERFLQQAFSPADIAKLQQAVRIAKLPRRKTFFRHATAYANAVDLYLATNQNTAALERQEQQLCVEQLPAWCPPAVAEAARSSAQAIQGNYHDLRHYQQTVQFAVSRLCPNHLPSLDSLEKQLNFLDDHFAGPEQLTPQAQQQVLALSYDEKDQVLQATSAEIETGQTPATLKHQRTLGLRRTAKRLVDNLPAVNKLCDFIATRKEFLQIQATHNFKQLHTRYLCYLQKLAKLDKELDKDEYSAISALMNAIEHAFIRNSRTVTNPGIHICPFVLRNQQWYLATPKPAQNQENHINQYFIKVFAHQSLLEQILAGLHTAKVPPTCALIRILNTRLTDIDTQLEKQMEIIADRLGALSLPQLKLNAKQLNTIAPCDAMLLSCPLRRQRFAAINQRYPIYQRSLSQGGSPHRIAQAKKSLFQHLKAQLPGTLATLQQAAKVHGVQLPANANYHQAVFTLTNHLWDALHRQLTGKVKLHLQSLVKDKTFTKATHQLPDATAKLQRLITTIEGLATQSSTRASCRSQLAATLAQAIEYLDELVRYRFEYTETRGWPFGKTQALKQHLPKRYQQALTTLCTSLAAMRAVQTAEQTLQPLFTQHGCAEAEYAQDLANLLDSLHVEIYINNEHDCFKSGTPSVPSNVSAIFEHYYLHSPDSSLCKPTRPAFLPLTENSTNQMQAHIKTLQQHGAQIKTFLAQLAPHRNKLAAHQQRPLSDLTALSNVRQQPLFSKAKATCKLTLSAANTLHTQLQRRLNNLEQLQRQLTEKNKLDNAKIQTVAELRQTALNKVTHVLNGQMRPVQDFFLGCVYAVYNACAFVLRNLGFKSWSHWYTKTERLRNTKQLLFNAFGTNFSHIHINNFTHEGRYSILTPDDQYARYQLKFERLTEQQTGDTPDNDPVKRTYKILTGRLPATTFSERYENEALQARRALEALEDNINVVINERQICDARRSACAASYHAIVAEYQAPESKQATARSITAAAPSLCPLKQTANLPAEPSLPPTRARAQPTAKV